LALSADFGAANFRDLMVVISDHGAGANTAARLPS
jgi:hypothetical protein